MKKFSRPLRYLVSAGDVCRPSQNTSYYCRTRTYVSYSTRCCRCFNAFSHRACRSPEFFLKHRPTGSHHEAPSLFCGNTLAVRYSFSGLLCHPGRASQRARQACYCSHGHGSEKVDAGRRGGGVGQERRLLVGGTLWKFGFVGRRGTTIREQQVTTRPRWQHLQIAPVGQQREQEAATSSLGRTVVGRCPLRAGSVGVSAAVVNRTAWLRIIPSYQALSKIKINK